MFGSGTQTYAAPPSPPVNTAAAVPALVRRGQAVADLVTAGAHPSARHSG